MKFFELLPVLALAAIAISPPLSTSCNGGDLDVDDPSIGISSESLESTSPRPSVADAADKLRVLSYNVFMRPDPLGWGDGSSCRARAIGEELVDRAESLDLVVLNETFEKQAVDRLVDALGDAFPYRALRKPNREFLSTNGGLSILSRYPIRELYSKQFDGCSSWGDCFAEKGFLHAVVELSSLRVNVLATHLDAGDIAGSPATRSDQLAMIREYLDTEDVGSKWPTMLMGDLNINGIRGLVDHLGPEQPNRSEYQGMLSTFARSCADCSDKNCLRRCEGRPVDAMRTELAPWAFTELQTESLHTMNCRGQSLDPCRSYNTPGTWRDRQRLDYVLKLRAHSPSRARAKFVDAEHLAFRDDSCGTSYLSDHKAVRADLKLRPTSVAETSVE